MLAATTLSESASTAAGEGKRPARSGIGLRQGARFTTAALVVAVLPIVVATVRGLVRGWVPVGDNAVIAVRSSDVLSSHPPLLGTWSSASVSLGVEVNNPGPLLFEVLAVPTRFFGVSGIAVGVALLNCLAVVGIAWFAHRRGGALVGTLAAAMAAALAWTMGSELLYEPWQPHSLLLPFLLFLVLVWSSACSDLVALPFVAGVGSLLLQTHLSYGFLVPILSTWAVLGLVLSLRQRAQAHGVRPLSSAPLRRATLATMLVLALCWAPPVVEQLFGSGEGNLGSLATNLGNTAQTLGYAGGARVASSVVSLPPLWFRPSFQQVWLAPGSTGPSPTREEVLARADLPSTAAAALSLAILVLLLVGCSWIARRSADAVASRAVSTAAVALGAALVTAGRTPISRFGIPTHQFRWLWSLGAFLFLAAAITLARRLHDSGRARASLGAALLSVATLMAVLTLPTSDQGSSAPQRTIPVSADLYRQIEEADIDGQLFFDLGAIGFADSYSGAIMAALQRAGVRFVVDSDWVSQLGAHRRYTGDNADAVLTQRQGDSALAEAPGERRVALHVGLSDDERAELRDVQARITSYIEAGELRLNRAGRAAIERGEYPSLEGQFSGTAVDPEAFFGFGLLVRLVAGDLLELDEEWQPRFARYAELQNRFDAETVGLFLSPIDR